MEKKIIGLVPNYTQTSTYFSDNYPCYGLRDTYSKTIEDIGGASIILPFSRTCLDTYVNTIDALISTGSTYYPGDTPEEHARAEFDRLLLQKTLSKGKPVLGICAGAQMLNLFFGGTLYSDLHKDMPHTFNHLEEKPVNTVYHKVHLDKNSTLFSLVKSEQYMVNSAHYQSVKDLASPLRVSARADDGIIEAIEHPDYAFCIGVQWHPEFLLTEEDKALFMALLAHA